MATENTYSSQAPQYPQQPQIARSNTPPSYTRNIGPSSSGSGAASFITTIIFIILALVLCGGVIYLFGGMIGPFEVASIQSPTLETLPQFTNQDNIIVNGNAPTSSKVALYVNGVETTTADTDSNGDFVAEFVIEEEKRYLINAVTLQQNVVRLRSAYSNTIETTLDKTAPLITVNKLTDQTTNNRYSITGRVSERAKITVDLRGNVTDVNSNLDGTFSLPVSLIAGDNNYTIYATDLAGNKGSTETGKVAYTVPSIGGGGSVKPTTLPNSAGELAKATQSEFIAIVLGVFALIGLLGYNAFNSVFWMVRKHAPKVE